MKKTGNWDSFLVFVTKLSIISFGCGKELTFKESGYNSPTEAGYNTRPETENNTPN